jgi:hypothetical protein
MDSNAIEIEMNGLQAGEDDIEFPSIPPSSFRNKGYSGLNHSGDNDIMNGPAESGSWFRSRIRTQNRWMICALTLIIVASIAFVTSGIYMSDEEVNSLVEPFESESGTVTNDAQNGKIQQILDNAQNSQNRSFIKDKQSHFGQASNPFADKVSHPGNQQGGKGGGKIVGGHGSLGKFQHGGDRGKINGNHQTNQVIGNSVDSSALGDEVVYVDDSDVYCEDLRQYSDWMNATVTKADGPMFKVLKQMDHDPNAFTYVAGCNSYGTSCISAFVR